MIQKAFYYYDIRISLTTFIGICVRKDQWGHKLQRKGSDKYAVGFFPCLELAHSCTTWYASPALDVTCFFVLMWCEAPYNVPFIVSSNMLTLNTASNKMLSRYGVDSCFGRNTFCKPPPPPQQSYSGYFWIVLADPEVTAPCLIVYLSVLNENLNKLNK